MGSCDELAGVVDCSREACDGGNFPGTEPVHDYLEDAEPF